MNHTITLTPKLNVAPQPVAPRLSLSRVLWYKILKCIEQSTFSALFKTCCKLTAVSILVWIIFAPSSVLGILTAILQWKGYRIPICIGAVALMLNAKAILRARAKWSLRRRGANQHTYNGVPVPELADFLLETQAFKRDVAIKRLSLSQGQYAKIATELEEKGILVRGEANARVLRPIGREHLAMQLRDNFPLVWDPERDIWVERDGQFNRWVLSNEFRQRKLDAEIEKKQRKLDRIENKIEEASVLPSSPLAGIFAHSGQ